MQLIVPWLISYEPWANLVQLIVPWLISYEPRANPVQNIVLGAKYRVSDYILYIWSGLVVVFYV